MDKKTTPDQSSNQKTAIDNQWVSAHLKSFPDKRKPRSGPGGE